MGIDFGAFGILSSGIENIGKYVGMNHRKSYKRVIPKHERIAISFNHENPSYHTMAMCVGKQCQSFQNT